MNNCIWRLVSICIFRLAISILQKNFVIKVKKVIFFGTFILMYTTLSLVLPAQLLSITSFSGHHLLVVIITIITIIIIQFTTTTITTFCRIFSVQMSAHLDDHRLTVATKFSLPLCGLLLSATTMFSGRIKRSKRRMKKYSSIARKPRMLILIRSAVLHLILGKFLLKKQHQQQRQ